ncbi:hypothetical protein AMTR_s00073p00143710 [Amborella trichopoda]|uniref:Uncharacterized protein n=1 Tax=Amborella trichopoda TaxID=13333 RepID=W1NNK8_AMBTC|nr:hypothetical protein AMTR_s00073p00143710 [Amborella trichopoda]
MALLQATTLLTATRATMLQTATHARDDTPDGNKRLRRYSRRQHTLATILQTATCARDDTLEGNTRSW